MRISNVSHARTEVPVGGLDDRDRLQDLARARFDASISATERFFASEVSAVSSAALDMARRFQQGGRLLVFAEGADATDAQHVSVEFVHPVIVGKRALPAIALINDVGTLTAARERGFVSMLNAFGRADDIALGIGDSRNPAMAGALEAAASIGMLTISIEPEKHGSPQASPAVHRFLVPGPDPLIGQEVGETLYHIFWELVHLFLEHGVAEKKEILAADSRTTT